MIFRTTTQISRFRRKQARNQRSFQTKRLSHPKQSNQSSFHVTFSTITSPFHFLKTFQCNKKTTSRRIPTPYAKRMMGFDITLDNTNSSISGHDNIKNTYCSFLIHFQTLCLKYNDIQDNNTNFT